MNDDLEISLAEEFAEYRRWWTAPPGTFPSRPYGERMSGALAALGPIEEWNIRPAIQLQLLHFKAAVERLRAAWRRLPPEFKKQVMAHFDTLDGGGEDWVWKAVTRLDLWPK